MTIARLRNRTTFITLEEASEELLDDAKHPVRPPSWDSPPDPETFPDPRELQRRRDGFFPPDPAAVPQEAPMIQGYNRDSAP